MKVFIAGAIMSAWRRAKRQSDNKSLAIPLAAFAMILPVAGATKIRSALVTRSIWPMVPGSSVQTESCTGRPLKARSIVLPTKFFAASVTTTSTSQPSRRSKRMSSQALYAAILPVIPRRIDFPLRRFMNRSLLIL